MKRLTMLLFGAWLLSTPSKSGFAGDIFPTSVGKTVDPQQWFEPSQTNPFATDAIDTLRITLEHNQFIGPAGHFHSFGEAAGQRSIISTSGHWAIHSLLITMRRRNLFHEDQVVEVSGAIQHSSAPHLGERGIGDPFEFKNLSVRADKGAPGTDVVRFARGFTSHPFLGDIDSYIITLTGRNVQTIFSGGVVFEFNQFGGGWSLDIDGFHVIPTVPVVPAPAMVPEPSTLLLLGSGLAGVSWFGSKKLLKKHKRRLSH